MMQPMLQSTTGMWGFSVEIQVRPLLLPLPIFAGVENNPSTDSKWYTITYEGIKGY